MCGGLDFAPLCLSTFGPHKNTRTGQAGGHYCVRARIQSTEHRAICTAWFRSYTDHACVTMLQMMQFTGHRIVCRFTCVLRTRWHGSVLLSLRVWPYVCMYDSMTACAYVCMCLYMYYVYAPVWQYVCRYACCVYECMYVCVCLCVDARIHAYMYVCLSMCMPLCLHVCVRVGIMCVYVSMYTCMPVCR